LSGSIGAAVDGWGFAVAFALMTVVLAMFAGIGSAGTMRMDECR
jgi:hypothetical protein